MKLSKFQIIGVLIICFIWFNSKKGGLFIPPHNPPDLKEANFEARVESGLYILLDGDLKNTPPERTGSVITATESKDEPQVTEQKTDGRFPRIVLFTNLKLCAPCIKLDRDVIQPLKKDGWDKYGWTIGDKNCVVEVHDVSVDQDDFFEHVEKYEKLTPDALKSKVDGRTPTMIKFNNKGEITKVVVGPISLSEFVNLHNEGNE